LNYPLAVNQLQSSMSMGQQNILQSSQQFQDQLRQQAYQNRLALTGQAASSGIGIGGLGSGVGASTLGSLSQTRGSSQYTEGWDPSKRMAAGGQLMSGIGSMMMKSDLRLKNSYGVVGKTDGGIDLHLFHYKGENQNDPLRLGVMAQDVEKVKPSAVLTNRQGVKFVDYARL